MYTYRVTVRLLTNEREHSGHNVPPTIDNADEGEVAEQPRAVGLQRVLVAARWRERERRQQDE